jgi:putative inorganic carbon (HCO3(-)) transporter
MFVLGVFGLTQSRSGYIGLMAGLAAMAVVWLPSRWRVWVIVGLLAVLIAASVFVSQRSAIETIQAGSGSSALSLDTLEGRFEVWSRALYGIRDFPITGMGLNTFRHIVHVLYPLFLIGSDIDLGHAHNEFLQAALDLGLPGLIAFVALYLGAFGLLWQIGRLPKAIAMREDISTRVLALGLGGGLVAHLVYGLTDAVALGAKPGLIFWMLLGLITGLFLQTHANGNVISIVDRNTEQQPDQRQGESPLAADAQSLI